MKALSVKLHRPPHSGDRHHALRGRVYGQLQGSQHLGLPQKVVQAPPPPVRAATAVTAAGTACTSVSQATVVDIT